ncbi:MAG: 4Fe-4S binding protein [Magnetococcales bacterium]|nr:4Fe-4S binding protein [Magnetococcales bacterium]
MHLASMPYRQRYLVGLMLLLGVFAQMAQALMLRELLAGFHGNELGIGAFYGSWLGWIGLGGYGATRLKAPAWLEEGALWRLLLLFAPFALLLGVALLRLARFFLDLPNGEFLPLGAFLLLAALATLPTGLLLGILFPLACQRFTASASPQRAITVLYLVESLGALIGGIGFTFLLVENLGGWRSLAAVSALSGAYLLFLPGGSRPFRLSASGSALLFLLAALPWPGEGLRLSLEAAHFRLLHPGMVRLDGVESRFGQIDLARLDNQYSLVHDGRLGVSFPAGPRARHEAAYYLAQAVAPRRILLLGGVESGLPEAMLRYPIEALTIVLQDPLAFELVEPWLPAATRQALKDPRLTLVFLDGRSFVNQGGDTAPFDLALILTGDPVNARQNRLHTREFHQALRRLLTPRGVVCTPVSSASNYLGREIESYSAAMDRTLKETFAFRVVAPGDQQLFCASNTPEVVSDAPETLASRHRAFAPPDEVLPASLFAQFLPEEQTRSVRQQLDQARGEVNTDIRPVSFYLNLLLWSKYTHSEAGVFLEGLRRLGIWPYLIPPGLFLLLLSLGGLSGAVPPATWRGTTAMGGVAAAGMAAMGLQLMLLYAYQALVGLVFAQVALLNGVFMAGLALGAGLPGRRLAEGKTPAQALIFLLMLVSGLALALPEGLSSLERTDLAQRQLLFPLLCAGVGLLTGILFPLGVALAQDRNALQASGVVEAADHLGGAVGGLLVGSLLLPLLGMAGAGLVMASITGFAALALALATFPFPLPPAWSARLGRHQKRPLLALLLLGGAIGVFLLANLAHRLDPPPQSRFSPDTLREVAGPGEFRELSEPFPHYRRMTQDSPETVVLASQPLAGEIRGYAATLNLLLALDQSGKLLAARHLHSHETPSYIEGLDGWLEKLKGHDFRASPLQEAGIDALSGATVSSRAALRILDATAQRSATILFGLELPVAGHKPLTRILSDPLFLAICLLLLGFFPVFLSAGESSRSMLLALSLLVLGFWGNSLWHEWDAANLSLGRWPDFAANPNGFVITLFVLLVTPLFGQVWCGYLCPYGALQEFISRLGSRLGWRAALSPAHEALAPWLRAGLAVVAIGLFRFGEQGFWIDFNPMQQLFGGRLTALGAGLAAAGLVGSLFFFRYGCRWFCPTGAILALGNRLALLSKWLPPRRIRHCDLGVESPFDSACLHCQRCRGEVEIGPANALSQRLGTLATLAVLSAILWHWHAGWQTASASTGGWRRIDVQILQRHIQEGRLAEKEALWYHPVEEGTKTSGKVD